jgi:hypothetical protein
VKLIVDKASLGVNQGYHPDGSSYVLIDAFDHLGMPGYVDDAVRAVFVAEISEILMSYNIMVPGRTPSWQPGSSNGEGLSRVAAAMFYKDAYYRVLVSDELGPPVNTWLLGSRADWISKIKASDVDRESFACSILFIYYLYSQLGKDMKSIVSKAGGTLEDTYKTLTGNSGGYKAFTELLSKYFPIGKTTPLPFDNPFPLQDSKKRRVDMSFDEDQTGPSREGPSGTAKLSPFHTSTCPVKNYGWSIANLPQNLICTASVIGFGQPNYKWRINGLELNRGDSISTTTTVQVDNPDDPYHPSSSMKRVQLHCGMSYEAMGRGGLLYIYNDDYPGHIILNVEVDVQEAYASTDVTSNSAIGILDSQELKYDDQYYKDRANCEAAFRKRISHMVQKVPHFVLLLTRPDPPPDLVKGIRVLVELATQVEKIANKKPKLAHEIAAILAHNFNVSERTLLRTRRRRNPKSRTKTKKKKQKKIG